MESVIDRPEQAPTTSTGQRRVAAFAWVPPMAQGLVRDLRVRWALEEAGRPYEARLLGDGEKDSPEYRAKQPFGQVPVYEENGVTMFESGAIVLHIGESCETLLPSDPAARTNATVWIFAALNSVEPMITQLSLIDLFQPDAEWAKLRRPAVVEMVEKRLDSLTARLGSRDYLDSDSFHAGDLMMTTVLRFIRHTDLVAQRPTLDAYKQRCEARPAFQKALAAQMAAFEEAAPV